MESSATLCDMIYREMVTNLYEGKLRCGDRLPTLQALCDSYGIGRNTARAVVQRLVDDGYAERINRKQVRVCFDMEQPQTRRRCLADLARRREAVRDVYTSLALLMPDVAAFCIDTASPAQCRRLAALCAGAADGEVRSEQDLFQRLTEVYQYALSLPCNAMLNHLFGALFQFILVPLSPTDRSSPVFSVSVSLARVLLRGFGRCIREGNLGALKRLLAHFCLATGRRSDSYLARVCAGLPVSPPIRFCWFCGGGQDYLHASLVADVARGALGGVYRPGDALPSYAELAAQAGVSEKTSRRAVAILARLGIVRTANGKRTRVLPRPVPDARAFMQDPFVARNLRACFEALQLAVLFCRPVILQSVKRLDRGQRAAFARRLQAPRPPFMEELLAPFFEAAGSPCVQTVFGQLRKAMAWGHLLEFLSEARSTFIIDRAPRLAGLVLDGGAREIADGFQGLLLEIFTDMRAACHRLGLEVDLELSPRRDGRLQKEGWT